MNFLNHSISFWRRSIFARACSERAILPSKAEILDMLFLVRREPFSATSFISLRICLISSVVSAICLECCLSVSEITPTKYAKVQMLMITGVSQPANDNQYLFFSVPIRFSYNLYTFGEFNDKK